MQILSVFNNKGGVGKSTLTYHLACALVELGKKVLLIDLDPQCNLTINATGVDTIEEIWKYENSYIEAGFEESKTKLSDFCTITASPRSIHFLLKPTEEGTGDFQEGKLPPPLALKANLDMIIGRLTLHQYENKIADRWSDAYLSDPLAIRTITRIRSLAIQYSEIYQYDFVVIDTSPSLGSLNKIVISSVDGFVIPCSPDLFTLYGIRNIGNSLVKWKRELETLYSLISPDKRKQFPENFVQFAGYTLYNAKKQSKNRNELDLATAHYNYVSEIKEAIQQFILSKVPMSLSETLLLNNIGNKSIIHSHNTYPNLAQKYHCPMWELPDRIDLATKDSNTILPNKSRYYATKKAYIDFTQDLIDRFSKIG